MSRRIRGGALAENLKMALRNMRANKGRSALVILGVSLGVTTLMAEVSIIQGFKNQLESEILSTDITQIYVTRYPAFVNIVELPDNPPLRIADAEAISDLPGIRMVDPRVSTGTVARHGPEKASLMTVAGTGLDYQEVENDFVEEGRFFNATEFTAGRDVCVIGRQPADDLFGGQDPIGKRIRVNESQELTVVGIFGERESIFGSLAKNYMILPVTTHMKHFHWTADDIAIVATPEGNDQLQAAQEQIEALMRVRHKLGPGKENDFDLATQNMAVDFTRQVTGPLTLVGVVLASIGLMVGGIGVITIMLVSVQERTREVGIRMAVGGTRRDIMQLFLVEAATLTGLGGLIGVVVGLLIGWGIHISPLGWPATVPLPYVLGAVLVSAGTGIFFGLYPALKASRLDPIESLRYE